MSVNPKTPVQEEMVGVIDRIGTVIRDKTASRVKDTRQAWGVVAYCPDKR